MPQRMRTWVAGSIALALVVLVAGWFLLVSPKRSAASEVHGKASAQQAVNATLRAQIAQLQAQAKGLVAKQAELQAVARRIPSQPQLPALIRALEDVHVRTGVDLVAVTPTTPTAATPTVSGAASYQVIPVTLQLQGDYSQMTLFLDELETLQRLYLVRSVTVAPGKADAGGKVTIGPDGSPETQHTLTSTVTGEVYDTTADTTDLTLPGLQPAIGAPAVGGEPPMNPPVRLPAPAATDPTN